MQTLSSILRLFPSRNAAASPSQMHRLSSPSGTLLSFMASDPPRWWPPALARRLFPLLAAPDPPVRRVSGSPHGSRNVATVSRVQGDESGKPYRPLPIPSGKVITISQDSEHYAISQGLKNIKTDNSKKMKNTLTRGTISEVMDEDERRSDSDACRATLEVIAGKADTLGQNVNLTGCEEGGRSATNGQMSEFLFSEEEGYTVNNILAESRHRDGSIYKDMDLWWKDDYRIADRNETRLEAMTFSDPTDCIIHDGTCMKHYPRCMLQIFSLEVAKIHVDGGLVELYGYIAVRDDLDPLLNYVANISRDDPIIVEQGSLINMSGPKRGIEMSDFILIEYDMRIKTGKHEKDDLQLIDGASLIGDGGIWIQPFTFHIPGDWGAVDITLSRLGRAVEATVEVIISEVQSNFSLSLGCLTSGLDVEIRLFDGTITDSGGIKKSVITVVKDSLIDLKFKLGAQPSCSDQYCCSFRAKTHGHDTHGIKTDFALISMKVTWSTLPCGFSG
ncbi:uncharacterized protein LOC124665939 [Lolium rigidum]|uniref:uncharacterized protein LOC124665939 n=1 Tax=Lolium rigidum TaxID=89674 RepID=UPI001F5C96A9|nr:uncharacterized protein LOC124665939 [Lolium rigidum]